MKGLYSSPLRVYLIFVLIAIIGIYSGMNLPVSLYPNSSKPIIRSGLTFGSLSGSEFLETYGKSIENSLRAIEVGGESVTKVDANYNESSVYYQVEFKWGSNPKEAKIEVSNILNSLSATWPKEIRDSLWINYWSRSNGFVAISYYSAKRDIDELFDIIDPIITPKISKIKETNRMGLWNPSQKEIRVVLDPYVMSTLGLFPSDIEKIIYKNLIGQRGGSLTVGRNRFYIQMPRLSKTVKDLNHLLIPLKSGEMIHLSEVAKIEYGQMEGHSQIMKTSGATSLILFGSPRAGGNVKKLAEEVIQIVESSMKQLPSDVKYRTLVDPSRFIRQSVNNVIHEVLLAAFLAVLVLFLFVGSFKNTVTAALEIPLSMVMAFIMMKISGMNINLISLGGLALAAGMNVDASIVVLENIFRQIEITPPKSFEDKLKLVVKAVQEVRLPIIASTISTLVVFAPLAFTKDLTNAILGDLAKAIVFSHGFSMFIALILVPTIRLHIFGNNNKALSLPKAPLDKLIKILEKYHQRILTKMMAIKKMKWAIFGAFFLAVILSTTFIVPSLKKEIIGRPDTDWMVLNINTYGNSEVKEMEETSDKIEDMLLKEFGEYIGYTFTQIRQANSSSIMARLKNKKDMKFVWKKMEEKFQNTPTLFYWVGPWNPAELPLPDPPHFEIEIKGGDILDQRLLAQDLEFKIKNHDFFPRVWSNPSTHFKENIEVHPNLTLWPKLYEKNINFTPSDLIDLSRVATIGKKINEMTVDGEGIRIFLKYPNHFLDTKEKLESYPIKVGNKFIPLKALASVDIKAAPPKIRREDSRGVISILAKQDQGKDYLIDEGTKNLNTFLENYKKESHDELKLKTRPNIIVKEAFVDLNNALKQLGLSVCLSILLIFFTLFMQFGSFVHSLIIMIAIPAGILGGSVSLYIFGSTLSLNSVLGIILLNGVAVNNSIILVDFIRKLHIGGMNPKEAAMVATKKRLKPILITTLTTILGMLPVAMGMGEGGKILRPLGIAVTGGLWVSTLFTLFLVPLLESMYLNMKMKKEFERGEELAPKKVINEINREVSP